MGWKNISAAFLAVTETVTDLYNGQPAEEVPATPHALNNAAEAVMLLTPDQPPLPTPLVVFTVVPAERDPCLPASDKPLSTVKVFVDNFIGLA